MKNHKRLKVTLGIAAGVITLIVPLVVVLLQVLGDGSSTTVIIPEATPTTGIDVNAEIQKLLLNIRDELRADVVWVEEYFLTPQGNSRGFSLSGSRMFSHVVRSSSDLAVWIVLGQRFTSGPSPAEPDAFISIQIEKLRVSGFYFVPTTSKAPFIERQLDIILGKSFYGIAGYNVRGSLVICVCISYFAVQTTLTENDLRRSTDDVQATVALLIES